MLLHPPGLLAGAPSSVACGACLPACQPLHDMWHWALLLRPQPLLPPLQADLPSWAEGDAECAACLCPVRPRDWIHTG